MACDKYQKILKHLIFDKYFSRNQRRQADKLCLISEIWNASIDNCKKCFVPHLKLIIDESLFPCKARRPFTQYMGNKTDKFWHSANAEKRYLCNDKPYLVKDLTQKTETIF